MDATTLEALYRTMYTIRYYNERLQAEFETGAPIPAGIHGSLGQEAPAAGVCQHLGADDWALASHRSPHVAIAKGVDLETLVAEQLGKAGGMCQGKGGEQHVYDADANFVSGAIVAQHLPATTGIAMAHKRRGTDDVAVGFVGDGAANQGAFYESLNLASVQDLPVVFVVEDNSWGISTPKDRVTAVENNAERAAGQGMPGVRVDENDVTAVHEAAGEAVERARAGEGPTLLEIKTYRRMGHFFQDPEGYRDAAEYEQMDADDCMPKIRADLREAGRGDAVEAVEAAVEPAVEDAIAAALDQPDPDPELARKHVFADGEGGV